MSYGAQQCTPLWSPQLYALGVPPVWAARSLLLWWADYCVHTGRYGWLPAQLVARPYLVWRLLASGGHGWMQSPGLWASTGPLVGGARSWGHWWGARSPGAGISLLVGRAGSLQLALGSWRS